MYSNLIELVNFKLLEEIENKVSHYFRALELTEGPSLYDLLVISLRPKDLIQKVRFIVLPKRGGRLDLSDFEHDSTSDTLSAYERTEAVVQKLGKEVAQDPEAFGELLPDLVCRNDGDGRLFYLGRG
ncbi:MAG: hypothetical protein IH945_08085, partial [Armatimonadetes bacterium]|nr:hypothetical protein [Armatimonadota bacterium]